MKAASVTAEIDGSEYTILLARPNGTNWMIVEKEPFVGRVAPKMKK